MKYDDFLKDKGRLWICEYCNYDLADIYALIINSCEFSEKSKSASLSRIMKSYKTYLDKKEETTAENERMKELLSKLRERK